MNQKPMIKGIRYSKYDFIDRCHCCNRKLKRVYDTDQGPMGINCFLTAIGMPRISSNSKKSPILTEEQYESFASGIIERLQDESINDRIVEFYKSYYEKPLKIAKNGTIYFFVKYIHHRTGEEMNENFDSFILGHSRDICRIVGIPEDMWKKVLHSKTMLEFWRNNRFPDHEWVTLWERE